MPLKVWIDGKLVAKDDAKISVYDHGAALRRRGLRRHPRLQREDFRTRSALSPAV